MTNANEIRNRIKADGGEVRSLQTSTGAVYVYSIPSSIIEEIGGVAGIKAVGMEAGPGTIYQTKAGSYVITIDANDYEIHPFERAGLGKAPFEWIGCFESRGPITYPNGMTVGAPGQPMGTCAFCGTGIAECHEIRSADGIVSIVGCECVRRVGATLKRVQEMKAEVRAINRKKRQIADGKRIEKIEARLQDAEVREVLGSLPHPSDRFAADGGTLLDYAEWLMANAGTAGKKRVGTMVERAMKARR